MTEWQTIETAPKAKAVLVYYKNSSDRDRVIKARFISKFTEENAEEWAEYNEEKDEYYTPEGWYEMIDNWDEYESVKMYEIPTHWQFLPEPPNGVKE